MPYDLFAVDQYAEPTTPDLVPEDPDAARELAAAIAFEATIYGYPAVLQYAHLARHVGKSSENPFNRFVHGPGLADAEYQAFRVPNVDTVYSNIWFDLTGGPVLVELPHFGDRYFTLNLFDAFSNASNISLRTHGRGPHRVRLVLRDQSVEAQEGVAVHRVATPIMWGLLRLQINSAEELSDVRELQRSVVVTAESGLDRGMLPLVDPDAVEQDAEVFFTGLDAVLQTCGWPVADGALVRRSRIFGVAGDDGAFEPAALPAPLGSGLREGFKRAVSTVQASRRQLGAEVGNGWTKVSGKGRHGQNFTARAVMNQVGLGANVEEENTSFNTFLAADGAPLDGSHANYRLALNTLPPVDHFWSVTVYDAASGRLCPNVLDRYAVGSATDLVMNGAGATIDLSHETPGTDVNWLPVPAGPFFLVLRCYGPRSALLEGVWKPPGVERVAHSFDGEAAS